MAVVEEERGGGNARIPPFFALSPTHTRLFPARPPGVSLVKSPAIYLCDWSGRGIYTQRGSVKSGHKFQNFQTGQTDRESGLSDGGEPSFGQTAHKQELLCSEKQTSEEKKEATHCGLVFRGISCTAACLFSLSSSSSSSSQISMLCFGICAPNPSNSSLDLSRCHLKHFELHIFSRTLQPNKLRQTFAGFHSD